MVMMIDQYLLYMLNVLCNRDIRIIVSNETAICSLVLVEQFVLDVHFHLYRF